MFLIPLKRKRTISTFALNEEKKNADVGLEVSTKVVKWQPKSRSRKKRREGQKKKFPIEPKMAKIGLITNAFNVA